MRGTRGGGGVLLADRFDVLLFGLGLHQDSGVVAEDAGDDLGVLGEASARGGGVYHDEGDGEEDPVAAKGVVLVGAFWERGGGSAYTRAGGPAGSFVHGRPTLLWGVVVVVFVVGGDAATWVLELLESGG